MVTHVHAVDPRRLACQVDVIRAGLGAGRHERLPVLDVRADRGDHDPCGPGELLHRPSVFHVGLEEPELALTSEPLTQLLQLGPVSAGQGKPSAGGCVPNQVLGCERTREPGCSEESDVVRALGGHALEPFTAATVIS